MTELPTGFPFKYVTEIHDAHARNLLTNFEARVLLSEARAYGLPFNVADTGKYPGLDVRAQWDTQDD